MIVDMKYGNEVAQPTGAMHKPHPNESKRALDTTFKPALRAKLQKPAQNADATHQTRHSKRLTDTPQVGTLHDCHWVYVVLCALGYPMQRYMGTKKVLSAKDLSVLLSSREKKRDERAE